LPRCKTLIPAASSGIFTGVILGMGRAIGETLAVSFIIGSNANSFPIKFITSYPYIELRPTSTLTVQMLFDFAEAPAGSLNIHAIWTLAFTLLVIAFLLVLAGRWISSRGVYSSPRRRRFNLSSLRRSRPASTPVTGGAVSASASTQVSIEGGAN